MICWEGRQWQHFVVYCLAMWGTIGMSYLWKAGKNWGRAYLFAESWPLWAHDVQFVEEILRERMMVVGASSSACWCNAFLSLSFCRGAVCLLAQKSVSCLVSHLLDCYTPLSLLLHWRSEPVGSAGANEMYHWPHNPAALDILLCIYTWPLSSDTHWGQYTHCYLSQASSSQLLNGIIWVLILKHIFSYV